jgi:hypothetical protein
MRSDHAASVFCCASRNPEMEDSDPSGTTENRQFVIRCLQQGSRQHGEDFRRRIDRQVKGFARNGLFALFAAIFPGRPAVLDFEMLFDRRLHVIIAVAIVFNRDTGVIEFPTRSDVVAAAAIVVGIFSAHGAVGLSFDGLRAGRVTLNKNFVGTMFRG